MRNILFLEITYFLKYSKPPQSKMSLLIIIHCLFIVSKIQWNFLPNQIPHSQYSFIFNFSCLKNNFASFLHSFFSFLSVSHQKWRRKCQPELCKFWKFFDINRCFYTETKKSSQTSSLKNKLCGRGPFYWKLNRESTLP